MTIFNVLAIALLVVIWRAATERSLMRRGDARALELVDRLRGQGF